jgi:hypothetical protein
MTSFSSEDIKLPAGSMLQQAGLGIVARHDKSAIGLVAMERQLALAAIIAYFEIRLLQVPGGFSQAT